MTAAQAAQLIQDVQEILWFLGVAVCVVSFYMGFSAGFRR